MDADNSAIRTDDKGASLCKGDQRRLHAKQLGKLSITVSNEREGGLEFSLEPALGLRVVGGDGQELAPLQLAVPIPVGR